MKPLAVLVADDENHIGLLIEQWLKPLGHAVAFVPDGTQAIKLLQRERFDLVVTDILMPESDGVKVIEEVKKTQPATHILAISGGGHYLETNDCLRMARGLGVDAAIMKPFVRETFLASVALAMKPRKAPEA
jgi:CheY-like chemotaxis protein